MAVAANLVRKRNGSEKRKIKNTREPGQKSRPHPLSYLRRRGPLESFGRGQSALHGRGFVHFLFLFSFFFFTWANMPYQRGKWNTSTMLSILFLLFPVLFRAARQLFLLRLAFPSSCPFLFCALFSYVCVLRFFLSSLDVHRPCRDVRVFCTD